MGQQQHAGHHQVHKPFQVPTVQLVFIQAVKQQPDVGEMVDGQFSCHMLEKIWHINNFNAVPGDPGEGVDELLGFFIGDGYHYRINFKMLHQLRQLRTLSKHRQTVNPRADFFGVIIDEPPHF